MLKSLSSSLWGLCLLGMLSSDNNVDALTIQALQSGPRVEGSTFPSAMILDPENEHIVHIIGNNEQSGLDDDDGAMTMCAYQSINLKTLETVHSLDFGTGKEVCHSLAMDKQHHQESHNDEEEHSHGHVHVVGHSSRGGLAVNVENCEGKLFCLPNQAYYGMILDIAIREQEQDTDTGSSTAEVAVVEGAAIMASSKVVYPLSVASDEETAYVLTLETDVRETVAGNDAGSSTNVTMMENPSEAFDTGSLFKMRLEAYPKTNYTPTFADDNVTAIITEAFTADDGWEHEFAPDNNEESILNVATPILLLNDEVIIVAGSTDGSGTNMGVATSANRNVDGFATKLLRSTGEVVGESLDTAGQVGSIRIATKEDTNEYVKSICRGNAKNHFFVTGSTTGRFEVNRTADGDTRAFLMKIKTETMEPEWSIDFGASPSTEDVDSSPVEGLACALNHDSSFVYVAGNVYLGGTMRASTTGRSAGGSDVFLAKIDAETGDLEFVRQIGSNGDEELAPRGGMILTKNEDVVLFGQTNGNLYRARNATTETPLVMDYFITIVSKDGSVTEPAEQPLPLTEPPTVVATEPPTPEPTTTAPTTTAPTDVIPTGEVEKYEFQFASIKLTLNGVGYIDTDAAKAFEETTAKWYKGIYEERLRRRLQEHNTTSTVTSFDTSVSYWGGTYQSTRNTITYNQTVSFKTDRADVDHSLAESLIVEPLLDDDNKQDYMDQLSASHETFQTLQGVSNGPKVPDKDRPKNAAGSLDLKLFLYIGVAVFIACICYGVFSLRKIEGKDAKDEEYDPKNDIDRPEGPLDSGSIA